MRTPLQIALPARQASVMAATSFRQPAGQVTLTVYPEHCRHGIPPFALSVRAGKAIIEIELTRGEAVELRRFINQALRELRLAPNSKSDE